MPSVCFCFELHQPKRLKKGFSLFNSIKKTSDLERFYFDSELDRKILHRVAQKCYYPATEILINAIEEHKKKFRFSMSLTGVFLEQCERYEKDFVELLRELNGTGCVEFLAETYYHSLASIYPDYGEFEEQVEMHEEAIKSIIGARPRTFRNTELIYNNSIAKKVWEMGYETILTEGVDRVLDWRSPNYVYRAKTADIKVLMRNYRLSDDIAFRFSSRNWEEYPLFADKYAYWLEKTEGDVINIFIDYETFGEHHWKESGIHEFLRYLPSEILKKNNLETVTVSEATERYEARDVIDVFEIGETISWADTERDLSAWLGNFMQKSAFEEIKSVETAVKTVGDKEIVDIWRNLQTSDNFYYMSTKGLGPGEVHSYFSHFSTPYQAYVTFMNVLSDLKARIIMRHRGIL